MNQLIFIAEKFPGLNEIIAAAKRSPYQYARMKQACTESVWASLHNAKILAVEVCFLNITWYEKRQGKPRDPDNVAAGKKWILDGMVAAGVIKNDSHQCVQGWTERVIYGDHWGVQVEICGEPD